MSFGHRLAVMLIALAVVIAGGPAAASAKVQTVPAAKVQRGYATFKLERVAPAAIRSAAMRVGHYDRRLRLAKVRRAAERGSLRVSMEVLRLSARRVASMTRRRKPKLVLNLDGADQGSPAPAPSTPTTDVGGTPAPTTSESGTSAVPGATTSEPGGSTSDPGTTPDPAKSTTRPPGSPPLSDAEAAARVRRSSFEPRPENAPYNARVPSAADLAAYRAEPTSTPEVQYERVTGNFTGTTDEIIQWAAHKWGLDEDKLRAAAAQESWWTQSYIGDAGHSPGLFQMRHDPAKSPVGHRLVRDYTAFNADLYGSFVRYYFDGACSWCNDGALTRYQAGQEWLSIGAHFNPYPWGNPGQLDYIQKVKDYLARRVWEGARF